MVLHPLSLCHTGDRSVPTRSRLNCKSPAFCWRPSLNWPFAAGHSCGNVKSEGPRVHRESHKRTLRTDFQKDCSVYISLFIWTITVVRGHLYAYSVCVFMVLLENELTSVQNNLQLLNKMIYFDFLVSDLSSKVKKIQS